MDRTHSYIISMGMWNPVFKNTNLSWSLLSTALNPNIRFLYISRNWDDNYKKLARDALLVKVSTHYFINTIFLIWS
jgi:hypothetical protein